jgi:hypothetical protein
MDFCFNVQVSRDNEQTFFIIIVNDGRPSWMEALMSRDTLLAKYSSVV